MVAVDARVVAGNAEQVDDDARAAGRFDRGYARGRTGVDVDMALGKCVTRFGKVQRDARR